MSNINSFTNYARAQLRDHFFRTGTYTKPAKMCIALTQSGYMDATFTGQNMSEVANANGYIRLELDPTSAAWSADATNSGTAWNLAPFNWPQANGGDWGWISGCVLTDASGYGAGNALFWGFLTTPKLIQNQDTFTIPISGIQVVIN